MNSYLANLKGESSPLEFQPVPFGVALHEEKCISGRTRSKRKRGTKALFTLLFLSTMVFAGQAQTNPCDTTRSSLSVTSCDQFTGPSGTVYTESDIVVDTSADSEGCPVLITLDLTILESTSNTLIESVCDSFISPSGKLLNLTGIYQDTIANGAGCDSLITIDLTVDFSTNDTLVESACDSFFWSVTGLNYTESGFYSDTLQSAAGCDSIRNLDLTVSSSGSSIAIVTSCGRFTAPSGKIVDSSQVFSDTIPTEAGCDSVITFFLTILPETITTESESACDRYTWERNGETYTETGIYGDTLVDRNGCDSIFLLELTILKSTTTALEANACEVFVGPSGKEYTQSGVFVDTIPNAVGCDSLITLTLDIGQDSEETQVVEACGEYELPGGEIVDSRGTYRDTLISRQGCDSIIITELTFAPLRITESVIACDFYTWPSNGATYSESGIYLDTVSGSNNCDTVRQLDLTVNTSSPTSTDTVAACKSFTWPSNGMTYDQSGIYTATLANAAGCDSIVRLNLTVTKLQFEVTASDGFFTAAVPAESDLQWLDCDKDFAPVPGATRTTFTPPDSTNEFALEVRSGACVDTSFCQSLLTVGLEETHFGGKLNLFPNPTTGWVIVDLGKTYGGIRAILRNATGQVVSETQFDRAEQFDLNISSPAGIYTLEIRTREGERAIVRLLKK